MAKDANKRSTIRVPKELNEAVKIAAIKKGMTKEALAIKFLEAGLKRSK